MSCSPSNSDSITRFSAINIVWAKPLILAGIPVAQVTAMVPVAEAVGANRIVRAFGIVYPVGDAGLSPGEELELRRRLVRQALDALAS